MENNYSSAREEVLARIKDAKDKSGKMWYQCFGNFFLNVAGCYSRQEMERDPSLNHILDRRFSEERETKHPDDSDLIMSKTQRQFWKNIDDAFKKAGTFERMMKASDELEALEKKEDCDNMHRIESELAETFIEPYILLREMGYSNGDLGY